MADIADVETTLVSLVTAALYPSGTAPLGPVGADCRIYRGWPSPAGLDADLRAGLVNVSIFPDAAPGQTMTPYPSEWHGTTMTPTLLAAVIGHTINFSGMAAAGQLVGIRIDNSTFVYPIAGGDTPASVAANLAAMIAPTFIVQLSGPTLTVPGAGTLIVRVVAGSPALREVRRQLHDFRISFWCPTPMLRDSACGIVDTTLAGLTFIGFSDASFGRIQYKNTVVFDQSQSSILYRRDLIYSIEYPTILSTTLPAMIFGDIVLGDVLAIA